MENVFEPLLFRRNTQKFLKGFKNIYCSNTNWLENYIETNEVIFTRTNYMRQIALRISPIKTTTYCICRTINTFLNILGVSDFENNCSRPKIKKSVTLFGSLCPQRQGHVHSDLGDTPLWTQKSTLCLPDCQRRCPNSTAALCNIFLEYVVVNCRLNIEVDKSG